MSNGPLLLNDDEFWGNCSRTEELVLSRIAKEDFQGLLIDGPERISVNQRDTAPVAGYFVRSLRNDLVMDQETQLLVAAVDLETNHLLAGLALDTGKLPGARPPKPTVDPGEGTVLNLFKTDLRRALNLPWQHGRYRIHALLREYLSNSITVEIGRSKLEYEDPEVAKFLEDERRRVVPPPAPKIFPPIDVVKPGLSPDYRHRKDSPQLPEKVGITISPDRVVALRDGAVCIMHGSYRLPILRREQVRPHPQTGQLPDVGDPRATAVVPITLLVTGSDLPGPWVFRLRVPSYDPIAPEAATAVAGGYFTLDLLQLPGFPRRAMTYFISAFNGENAAGPSRVALISEDMLPK